MSYVRLLQASSNDTPLLPPACFRSKLRAAQCGEEESLLALCIAIVSVQIVCSLIGLLAAERGGLLVVSGLFALVAIYERSRYLCCTYAAFFCSIVIDISRLALCMLQIRYIEPQKYGPVFIFVARVALAAEIMGCVVRIFSSLTWIHIIRTGLLAVRNSDSHRLDSEVRGVYLGETSIDHGEKPHGKELVIKDDEAEYDDESGSDATIMDRRPWGDMPPEILLLFLDRLPLPGRLRFSGVCQSWKETQEEHRLTVKRKDMPWLMHPVNDEIYAGLDWQFFSPGDNKFYKFPVEQDSFTLCGYSKGFLLYFRELKDDTTFCLFNPFTECQVQLSDDDCSFCDYPLMTLSKSPEEEDSILFAWPYESSLWRPAQRQKMQTIRTPRRKMSSVGPVSSDNGKVFIPLDSRWSKCLILDPLRTINVLEIEMNLEEEMSSDEESRSYEVLVTCKNQILLARVTTIFDNTHFRIFRADVEKRVWQPVKSLGSYALFLSYNQYDFFDGESFGLCSSEYSVTANRIYATGLSCFSNELGDSSRFMWLEYDYASHQLVNSSSPTVPEYYRKLHHQKLQWVLPTV